MIKNKMEGIGYYTHEIMKRVVLAHPEHEFVFLFDRTYSQEFIFSDNVRAKIVKPPARHPLLWYFWFEQSLPPQLKKIEPDLFISLDGFLSLKSKKLRSLLVIHDLAFEHYPEHVPALAKWYYKSYVHKFAKSADRIISVSEFSKNDIIEQYAVEPAKIDIVHNAPKGIFKPISEEERSTARNNYAEGSPYFIYVGAIQPRKNLSRAFQAFDKFKESTASQTKFLIVGREGWQTTNILDTYKEIKYKEDILFLDYLPLEELVMAIGAAKAMVYVSYFEGFGVPIVEAMKAGVAVVTSDASSLPEVAGGATLLVDPFS
ncbi:MAG: glycosyltransferase family 4 protein, partial [Bacteroidetes bacterium]|nr:glycosyltransferase family 4 protein [Bacteroidota bacterium]